MLRRQFFDIQQFINHIIRSLQFGRDSEIDSSSKEHFNLFMLENGAFITILRFIDCGLTHAKMISYITVHGIFKTTRFNVLSKEVKTRGSHH